MKNADGRLESIRIVNTGIAKKNRTVRMEDYIEVIYELIQQKGYATTTDISAHLNVSLPSVTKMMKKLAGTGHLNYEKYRGVRLTQEGMAIAESIRERHSLLTEFFKIIGVKEGIANEDAEGIEHHLHPETLTRLKEHVRQIKSSQSMFAQK
jgi:Mn-dependent DtxR family transcriptional regulator